MNRFLSLLFILAVVFAFSFINDALIVVGIMMAFHLMCYDNRGDMPAPFMDHCVSCASQRNQADGIKPCVYFEI